MNRCCGLLGWIFGHKYIKTQSGWVHTSDYCFRCGRERGQ